MQLGNQGVAYTGLRDVEGERGGLGDKKACVMVGVVSSATSSPR